MSSSRRVAANRANAERSTGPRSIAGKGQARLNAVKHRPAIPAAALPELTHDITELAERMAGPAADNPSVLQAAMRVVAVAVDVDRVRWTCRDLLERLRADPEFHDPSQVVEPMPDRPERTQFTQAMRVEAYRAGSNAELRKAELAQLTAQWAYENEVEGIKRRRANAKQRVKQHALQWDQLARLERYERRAVSQRNSAIRAFDEAVAAARKGPSL